MRALLFKIGIKNFYVLLALIFFSLKINAQTTTYPTLEPGAYIMDMGVVPQTEENALRPYGLVFEMLNTHTVKVLWAIKPGKVKDGVDFTYDGKDFRGGPFIIEKRFRTPAVDSSILAWEASGVMGVTTTDTLTIPLALTLSYSMRWTLDRATGNIAKAYLDRAGIPDDSYDWILPTFVNCCTDIFVLPHADPTWDTHGDLLEWNSTDGCTGSLWLGCHAVSVLENTFNPANPSEKINFLMQDPLTPGGESAVDFGDHDNGTTPPTYVYDYHDDPIMQFMGIMDDATHNGSEQIYLPRVGWRPTTKILVQDTSHPDVPTESPGPAPVTAYGRALSDPTRGWIMYQGGHDLSGGSEEQEISAIRSFINYSYFAIAGKGINVSTSVPPEMDSEVTYQLSMRIKG